VRELYVTKVYSWLSAPYSVPTSGLKYATESSKGWDYKLTQIPILRSIAA